MVGIEIALAFIIIETIVAIVMIHNVAINARCKECHHCLRLIRDEQHKKQDQRDMNYHYWTEHRMIKCNDPNCPGRK